MDDSPPNAVSARLQAAMADYRHARERRWAARTRFNECIRATRESKARIARAEDRLARAEAFLKERERRLHKAVMAEPPAAKPAEAA